MPAYVTLINFTEKGIRDIKDVPQRMGASRKAIEDGGFIGMGRRGYIRTESLRAFTEDQARDIIAKIQ